MCCCHLLSSSGRSPPSASATRSRLPSARGCGSAASFRWDTRPGTARSSWLRRRPSGCGPSFAAISSLAVLNRLMADLRERGTITKVRSLKSGRTIGGIPFTRGPLAHLLRNRFYIGEVALKGDILPGEQPAILDGDLFAAVQAKLNEQRNSHTVARYRSEALLIGRLYDDRGNRMTPSHVRKGGIKYRYYLSSPLLHGQPGRAGSMRRVPAAEVEALVASAVREHFKDSTERDDRDLIRSHVVRVELRMDQ